MYRVAMGNNEVTPQCFYSGGDRYYALSLCSAHLGLLVLQWTLLVL